MGMRKFWSVALPFGKVVYVVKVTYRVITEGSSPSGIRITERGLASVFY